MGPGSGTTNPLLFERLVDAGPDAGPPANDSEQRGRAQLEASVEREIGALLNSRIAWDVDAIEPAERTVLDYGLPDFSGMSARSDTDRYNLARAAERAIRAFEPRLVNPRVSVVETRIGRATLEFTIAGSLTFNAVTASHAFALASPPHGDADGG